MSWFYKLVVLFEHTFDCTTTLDNVAFDSACKSHIIISMNKNFEIKELRVYFEVKQRKNPLEDD